MMKRTYSYLLTAALLACVLLLSGCAAVEEEAAGFTHDHDHEHGDLPFEWSGEFSLAAGTYTLEFQESDDPSCAIAFLVNDGEMDSIAHHAHHVMEAEMETVPAGGHFNAWAEYGYVLMLNPNGTTFTFTLEEGGDYVIFLEHMPWEFDLKILDSSGRELIAENPREYDEDDLYH